MKTKSLNVNASKYAVRNCLLFFLFITFLSMNSAFAQVKVTTNGDLKIASGKDLQFGNTVVEFGFEYWDSGLNLFKEYGSVNAGNYKMFMNENTCNLGVNLTNNNPIGKVTSYANSAVYTSDKRYAFYGYTTSGLGYTYGIYGLATRSSSSSDGRAYGVYGLAANSSAGFNYGVYGIIAGSNDGAGVFGTTTGDADVDGKYAGYFYGDAKVTGKLYYYQLQQTSDITAKKDIKNLDTSAVSKLTSLNAINYKYKSPVEMANEAKTASDTVNTISLTHEEIDFYNQNRIGFVAQEVQKLYPELVSTDPGGVLAVDYVSLIPIIIEALKDQKSQIELLKNKLNTKLKSADDNTFNVEEIISEAILGKNKPNPFNSETTIKYFIPSDIKQATLYIYDLQGRQIKSISITGRESGTVTIYASELQAGMYKYALITDGQVIGVETMILTD